MTITRRSAIKAIASAFALPALNPITSVFAQSSPEWTTYEIVTEVNLENTNGAAEAWIPLPLVLYRLFQDTVDQTRSRRYQSGK